MLQFTRHPITCGLVIEPEHISESETLTFCYTDQQLTIGAEPYSLVICPQGDTDNPFRIEGLRTIDDTEDGDIIEIWFIGTIDACITEFERITAEIRSRGHQITEPDTYDFEKEIREYHKRYLANPLWSGQPEHN